MRMDRGSRMFDVYMIEREALMVSRPRGSVDMAAAIQIVEFVEIKEMEFETGFNRFIDLTQVDTINLSAADVSELAARRRKFNPNGIRVKSAFMATHPLALGIARMYEQLLNSHRIEVRVFSEIEAAADWLAVKPSRLKL
jgi:hypothetical protein